jgi:hypothetical protein
VLCYHSHAAQGVVWRVGDPYATAQTSVLDEPETVVLRCPGVSLRLPHALTAPPPSPLTATQAFVHQLSNSQPPVGPFDSSSPQHPPNARLLSERTARESFQTQGDESLSFRAPTPINVSGGGDRGRMGAVWVSSNDGAITMGDILRGVERLVEGAWGSAFRETPSQTVSGTLGRADRWVLDGVHKVSVPGHWPLVYEASLIH